MRKDTEPSTPIRPEDIDLRQGHNLAYDPLYKKDPGSYHTMGNEYYDLISPPGSKGYPEGYCEARQKKMEQTARETREYLQR